MHLVAGKFLTSHSKCTGFQKSFYYSRDHDPRDTVSESSREKDIFEKDRIITSKFDKNQPVLLGLA